MKTYNHTAYFRYTQQIHNVLLPVFQSYNINIRFSIKIV
jgi:hypothetical protein